VPIDWGTLRTKQYRAGVGDVQEGSDIEMPFSNVIEEGLNVIPSNTTWFHFRGRTRLSK
jgi:hypothetical protein